MLYVSVNLAYIYLVFTFYRSSMEKDVKRTAMLELKELEFDLISPSVASTPRHGRYLHIHYGDHEISQKALAKPDLNFGNDICISYVIVM